MRRSPLYFPLQPPNLQYPFFSEDPSTAHPFRPHHQSHRFPESTYHAPPTPPARSVITIPVHDPSASPLSPPPPSKNPSHPHSSHSSVSESSYPPARDKRRLDVDTAATIIQSHFRGFSIRRHGPLPHLRSIVASLKQLEDLKSKLESPGFSQNLRINEKERVRFNEAVMVVLLRLDAVEGSIPEVRSRRKEAIRLAIALQDLLDAIMVQGKHQMSDFNHIDASASAVGTPMQEEGVVREERDAAFQMDCSITTEDKAAFALNESNSENVEGLSAVEHGQCCPRSVTPGLASEKGNVVNAADEGLTSVVLGNNSPEDEYQSDKPPKLGFELFLEEDSPADKVVLVCTQEDEKYQSDKPSKLGLELLLEEDSPADKVVECTQEEMVDINLEENEMKSYAKERDRDGAYSANPMISGNDLLDDLVNGNSADEVPETTRHVDNAIDYVLKEDEGWQYTPMPSESVHGNKGSLMQHNSTRGLMRLAEQNGVREVGQCTADGVPSMEQIPEGLRRLERSADNDTQRSEHKSPPPEDPQLCGGRSCIECDGSSVVTEGFGVDDDCRAGLAPSDRVLLQQLSDDCKQLKSMLSKLMLQSRAQSKVICALGDRLEALEHKQQHLATCPPQQKGRERKKSKKGSKKQ